jgi:hypothetical protein
MGPVVLGQAIEVALVFEEFKSLVWVVIAGTEGELFSVLFGNVGERAFLFGEFMGVGG